MFNQVSKTKLIIISSASIILISMGIWYYFIRSNCNKIDNDSSTMKMESKIDDLVKKRRIERGEIPESDGELEENKNSNEILFYADINYNDPEPFQLLPGKEIMIYKRVNDSKKEDNLPGSGQDLWNFQSLQFKGEVSYQLKVKIKSKEHLINLSDYSETGIPNMIDWLRFNLPKEEKDIVNHVDRRSIIISINKYSNEVSGTGIPEVKVIVFTGINYEMDLNSLSENKVSIKLNEPVEICKIESKFDRSPGGEYEYDGDNILVKVEQKKTWKYKSMKIEPNSTIRLTVYEEDPSRSEYGKLKYNKVFLDYTVNFNIPNLIVWLETRDQDVVKYSPYNPINNERIYTLELIKISC